MTPLAAFTRYRPGNTPLAVNHQGVFVASTISFNLQLGASPSDPTAELARARDEVMNDFAITFRRQFVAHIFLRYYLHDNGIEPRMRRPMQP
jgi:multidrug efflux pump